MQKVDKISVHNSAGFNLKFKVKWDGGESGWTDDYPLGKTKTIDLNNSHIPQGGEVWPVVHAVLGKTKSASSKQHVQFERDCNNNATYKVTGATHNIHIKLEGE